MQNDCGVSCSEGFLEEMQLQLCLRGDEDLDGGMGPTKGTWGVGLQRGTGCGPRPPAAHSLIPV